MNYTSIEQSNKLLELGLPRDTADMVYEYNFLLESNDTTPKAVNSNLHDTTLRNIPCWSIGALMDLLPPSIQTGNGLQNQYEIDIRKYWLENELCLYQIAYGNDRGLSEEWHDMINTGEKENLLNAAFEMVVWLLKNGYIKTEKK